MIYHTNKSALFSEKEKKGWKQDSAASTKRKTMPSALDPKRDRKQRMKSIKDWYANQAQSH